MKSLSRAAAVLSAAVLLPLMGPGSAHAQDRPWIWGVQFVKEGLRACGGDIAELCGRTVPGQGRIAQCLTDHYDELAPACQRFVDRSFDIRNAMFACAADADRHCAGLAPGGGRIAVCLLEQQDVITDACRDALTSVMGER